MDYKLSVLVVDDEKTLCNLICLELEEEGYICDSTTRAKNALKKIKKHKYDLVLLDIRLPEMSGIDLLKEIKKCHPEMIIIMLTAVNDLDTAVEVMKLGASDYIIKPFTLDKLEASISTVLRNRNPQCKVYNTIPSLIDTEYDNSAKSRSLSEINAIAFGVDAQVDYFDFHSRIVTDKTVELARWLGLPRREIKKWAVARDELYNERNRKIRSVLSKLERSPMAQVMLGLTRTVCQCPESGDKQN